MGRPRPFAFVVTLPRRRGINPQFIDPYDVPTLVSQQQESAFMAQRILIAVVVIGLMSLSVLA